jgi:CDP-diacylglycerol--glycerol-3-phosphate 3-phosphatidyltransferase
VLAGTPHAAPRVKREKSDMTQQQKSSRRFETLTDLMRFATARLTTRIGHRLYMWGIHPDLITFVGLVFVAVAAYMIAQGEFVLGAIILIAGMPLDAVDGAVARAMQRKDQFGALWDSVLDRYADGFIFMGLAYYFSGQDNRTAVALSVLAMLGTQLVSYVRARAEGLDLSCKVGLFTRMERVVVILIMLLTGWVMAGLWVLTIGTHITVIQRIWHVYRAIKKQQQGETL